MGLFSFIGNTLSDIGSGVMNTISGVLGAVGGAVDHVGNTVMNHEGQIISGVADAYTGGAFSAATSGGSALVSGKPIGSVVKQGLLGYVKGALENKVISAAGAYKNSSNTILSSLSSVTAEAQHLNNTYYKPYIAPIVSSIQAAKSGYNKIEADLHGGLKGVLKLPGDVVNTLTGIQNTVTTAVDRLNAGNASTASDIFTPAIKSSGEIPIGKLTEHVSQAFPYSNLDVNAYTSPNLDTPPGEDDITRLLAHATEFTSKQGGWVGEVLSGIWDILTSLDLLGAYMKPRGEVYADMAWKSQPTKRLDVGTVQQLYGLGYISEADAKEEIVTQGYDADRQSLYLALTKHVFDIATALDLYHRGELSQADLSALFTQLSYDESQAMATQAASFAIVQPQEAIRWWWRGFITGPDLDRVLRANRYTDVDVENVLRDAVPPASAQGEIGTRGRREAQLNKWLLGFDLSAVPEDIIKLARESGTPDDDTINEWVNHWNIPGANFWADSYFRGLIELDEVYNGFRALNIPQPLWDTLIGQQHTIIRLTYIASLIVGGMISPAEGEAKLKAYGYSEGDAQLMLKYAQSRTKKTRATTAKTLHEVSIGVAVGLYIDHALKADELVSVLVAHGYSEHAATLTVELETLKLQAKERKTEGGFLVDMVELGNMTMGDAMSRMYDLGFTGEEVLHYEKTMAHTRAKKHKLPGEGELLKLFKKSIIDETVFFDALVQSGYSDVWAQRIIDLNTMAG